jgi:LytS/YehU family sensor histidine kinase
MMRYLLYESEQGETRLSSEIDFMNNYIDLMRLRISEKVKLDVSFPAKYENIAIPPLLFISIIENALSGRLREKSFDIAWRFRKIDYLQVRTVSSINRMSVVR